MRFYIATIFIVLTFFLKGQGGLKREYRSSGSLTNWAKAVLETSPNNYIVGGVAVDTVNGNPINRLALMGLNYQGQKIWEKKYGTAKFQYLDNLLITRWFYKQGNYFYHVGSVLDSNSKYIGVFIKFNFNGDTIWQKRFYDVNFDVNPEMVTGSIDGGFLISGFLQQTGNQPILIIKTDANGNEIWRKQINKASPNVHDGKAIVQDTSSKKIIITGYQFVGSETKDHILICDSLGNKLSQTNYSGILGGYPYDLIQTKDKKMVMVGNAIYPQMIGGTNLNRSFIVKFDLNAPAIPIWKIDNYDKLALGNSFLCLRELKNGTLLVAGGIDTMLQLNLPRQSLNRLTKIDKNGNVLWNRHYNYSTNTNTFNTQSIMSLEIANNGDWLTAVQITNTSPDPYFFVRYDSTGCDSTVNYCLSVGIDEKKNLEESICIYPNPVKAVINISFFKFNIFNEKINYKLIDVAGRAIKENELSLGGKQKELSININEIDKGVYFLQLYNDNKLVSIKKIIKE